MVHAAIHARRGHDRPAAARRASTQPRAPSAAGKREGHEQGECHVHGDGRGNVAGGKALVRGQVVEPQHGRALAVHEHARDPVGRDLDQDRAEHEPHDAASGCSTAATITTSERRARGGRGCRRWTSPRSSEVVARRRCGGWRTRWLTASSSCGDGVDLQDCVHEQEAQGDRLPPRRGRSRARGRPAHRRSTAGGCAGVLRGLPPACRRAPRRSGRSSPPCEVVFEGRLDGASRDVIVCAGIRVSTRLPVGTNARSPLHAPRSRHALSRPRPPPHRRRRGHARGARRPAPRPRRAAQRPRPPRRSRTKAEELSERTRVAEPPSRPRGGDGARADRGAARDDPRRAADRRARVPRAPQRHPPARSTRARRAGATITRRISSTRLLQLRHGPRRLARGSPVIATSVVLLELWRRTRELVRGPVRARGSDPGRPVHHHRDRGPHGQGSSDAQSGGCVTRAVVPERALLDRGRDLRSARARPLARTGSGACGPC